MTTLSRAREIICSPVSAATNLACLKCKKPVLIIHPDRNEVPGGGYWLHPITDMPELYQKLTYEQKYPSEYGFEFELSGTHCPHCARYYYVVIAHFMPQVTEDIGPLINYETARWRNHICRIEGADTELARWVMGEFDTPRGILHAHYIGPFPAYRKLGKILLSLWNDLRALHPEMAKCSSR